MSCGMVRKVDELGRVVIPKEMRRILNIRTGCSIEMFIDDSNHVVLKKFSEMENIYSLAENLAEIIFLNLNLRCFVCDDEKVLLSKGLNKKEFNDKKVNKKNIKTGEINLNEFISNFNYKIESKAYIFNLNSEGYITGNIVVLKDDLLSKVEEEKIELLANYFCSLMKF